MTQRGGSDPAIAGNARPAHVELALERRISSATIVGAAAVFLAILVAVPSFNPTFDDAKYVGIGRSLLAGLGPTTVFGVPFLNHSPLWPLVIALPEQLVGFDPIAVGHVLNGISGAVVVVLAGLLGWRVRPVAGALAATGMVGFAHLHDLARTAGLDLPSAALTLAYLLVALEAIRLGSVRWAIAPGALFAAAFLIKETALPFAPAPFLAAVMWATSWRRLARTAGWTLGVAALGLAWWFAMYALNTYRVYRLDTPAWTLLPLAVAVIALAIGLANAERLVVPVAIDRRLGTLRRQRAIVGWGLIAAWLALLLVVFWRTPKLLGGGLLDPTQLGYYATRVILSVKLGVAFGATGIGLVLVGRLRGRSPGEAAWDLAVALTCGVPLVLLVIGVGETPRHYVVEMALLIALGAAGWAWLVLSISAVPWTGSPARRSAIVGLVVVLALAGASGTLAVHARGVSTARDALEEQAAETARTWLREHAGADQTVAFGPYLGYEIALDLPAGVTAVRIRPMLVTADPTAPLGIRTGQTRPTDIVALDVAAGKANQFQAYSASQLEGAIGSGSVDLIVYATSRLSSAAEIIDVLTPEAGLSVVGSWSFPGSTDTIDVRVYRVDPAGLRIDPGRLHAAPDALARLTDRLERAPEAGRVAAGNLLDRLDSTDPELVPIVERLRRLAGR